MSRGPGDAVGLLGDVNEHVVRKLGHDPVVGRATTLGSRLLPGRVAAGAAQQLIAAGSAQ